MLGNIVGGFIVILVGVTLAPTVNLIAHSESNFIMHNPESRLKSLLNIGQDRSVNTKPCFEYARTTDKGFHNLEGYTVWSHNINKMCVNKKRAQQVGLAQLDGNITGASDTILGLTSLFYNLSIASTAIGERNAHKVSDYLMRKPESRLTSLLGQDRSVNVNSNARETDKGFLENNLRMIYSPNSKNKIKLENNNLIAAQGGVYLKPLQEEIFDETAESRLTSLLGQDRSVKYKNYARTTDNAYFTFSLEDESKIYSLNFGYNLKPEINKFVEKQRTYVNSLREVA